MKTYYDYKTREMVTEDYLPVKPGDFGGPWDTQVTERRPATELEIAGAEQERAGRRQDSALQGLTYCRPSYHLKALARIARHAAAMADDAPGQPGLMAELRLALAKAARAADSELERRHDLLIEEGDATREYKEWTEQLRELHAAERGEQPAAVEVAL